MYSGKCKIAIVGTRYENVPPWTIGSLKKLTSSLEKCSTTLRH